MPGEARFTNDASDARSARRASLLGEVACASVLLSASALQRLSMCCRSTACSSCMQHQQQRPEAAWQTGSRLVRRPWLRPFESPQQQQQRQLRQQRCQRERLQRAGSRTCASAAASPAFEVGLTAHRAGLSPPHADVLGVLQSWVRSLSQHAWQRESQYCGNGASGGVCMNRAPALSAATGWRQRGSAVPFAASGRLQSGVLEVPAPTHHPRHNPGRLCRHRPCAAGESACEYGFG